MADEPHVTWETNRRRLNALGEAFPRNAIKQRVIGGGRKGDYVETHTVIHRLNSVAGEWSFRIVGHEWRDDLMIVHGELTIPGLGTRSAFGVQRVDARGGDDIVKGGASDALKKCATLFGVALDLYGTDYEAVAEARNAPPARKPEPVRDEPPDKPDNTQAMRRLHKVASDRGIKHEQLSDWAYDKHKAQSLSLLDARHLTQLADALEKGGPQVVAAFSDKYPMVPDDATQPRLTDADEATIANYERLGQ